MLAKTGDDNEALKRQLEREHPEWSEPKHHLKPIGDLLKTMMDERLPLEHYAHGSWWIMRVKPNCYQLAGNSLKRKGFEFYSPTFKILRQMPLRLIPPKKREQSKLYKQEIRRRRFEGYGFVRRMYGTYDVNRLFDLDGCGGIVKNTGSIALVRDYEVELMRLVEADGTMDETAVAVYRGYKVMRLQDDQQWVGQSQIIGRLDDCDRTVLFVERMGRIAQLISQADPA